MYAPYEAPQITVSVFYFDTEYRQETAEQVLEILERNHLFLPFQLRAGLLTGNRMKRYRPEMRELFVRAYSEPDVLSVEWDSAHLDSGEDWLSLWWLFTFLKRSAPVQSSFHPWNILTFYASYGWLRPPERQVQLLQCVPELCHVLNAFCAKIDDVANCVALLNEPTFSPDHIQQTYWGNYWGGPLKDQVDMDRLRALDLPNFSESDKGVFFTLTDDVFEFDSPQCRRLRKKIAPLIKGGHK